MHRNAVQWKETSEDDCPRCGDDKLRGFEDNNWVVCWSCEWTIEKTAWIQAWRDFS